MPKSARSLAARATDEQRARYAELRAEGKSSYEIAREIGVDTSTVKQWLRDDPGTAVALKREAKALATEKVVDVVKGYIRAFESDKTPERERKEYGDRILAIAGMDIKSTSPSTVINIQGEQVNVAALGSGIDKLLHKAVEIAKAAYPEVERIVDAEFSVGGRVAGEDADVDAAGGAGVSRGGDSAGEGAAPAQPA